MYHDHFLITGIFDLPSVESSITPARNLTYGIELPRVGVAAVEVGYVPTQSGMCRARQTCTTPKEMAPIVVHHCIYRRICCFVTFIFLTCANE